MNFQDLKNLLRRGLAQERDEQEHAIQLEEDLNMHNQSNHVHHIINLDGDNATPIVINQGSQLKSLSENISEKSMDSITLEQQFYFFSTNSSYHEGNHQLKEPFMNQTDQQKYQKQLDDIENKFISSISTGQTAINPIAHDSESQRVGHQASDIQINPVTNQNNQAMTISITNSLGGLVRYTTEFQSGVGEGGVASFNNDDQAIVMEEEDMLRIMAENDDPIVRRLVQLGHCLKERKNKLTIQIILQQKNPLNELSNIFWTTMQMKLKVYQKLVISTLLFQAAFLIITTYWSFRSFDMDMKGAKLIILYLIKNVIGFIITNEQLKNTGQKIEDFDSLKTKLEEEESRYSKYIDSITVCQTQMNQLLKWHRGRILNQLNLEPEPCPQGIHIGNARWKLDALIEQISQLLNTQIDLSQSQKSKEIFVLLLKMEAFKVKFEPLDEFLMQSSKQSISRINQVLLRESSIILFLYYLHKIFVVILSILNCMFLFTEASLTIPTQFIIVLWMNLVQDNIQILALTSFIIVLVVIFILYFIFTKSHNFIKHYLYKMKLKSQISSLKRSQFSTDASNSNLVKECSICLNEYQPNELITTLKCDEKHNFHDSCIMTWINMRNECPLCRAPIIS